MKLAAIDIGSNAVRCLISEVSGDENITLKTCQQLRLPVRLGDEAFTLQKISDEKINTLSHAMSTFSNLLKEHKVVAYRAYATSAMRHVHNSNTILHHIKQETNIQIEIIDGKKEAEIALLNQSSLNLKPNASYLYIDVGGGSAEISIFSKKQVIASRCFEIGSIRFLVNQVKQKDWELFKKWVKNHTANLDSLIAIGSGGNINKAFKLSGKNQNQPLSYERLKTIYKSIKAFNYEERMAVLDLAKDRADVITPAIKIYLEAMKLAHASKIYVPKISLATGILRQLYTEQKEK